MRIPRSVQALLAVALLASMAPAAPAAADHTSPPASVAVPGSFNDELGCPGDWLPECVDIELEPDLLGNGDGVWRGDFSVPAGDWEYKAALNDSWDENYGANAMPGGDNILLGVADTTDVRFYYSHETHWITDNQTSRIASAPGSYQDEIGCPGDWQPECLRSWLQDIDGDGIYELTTTAIPAGDYEAKVAIDESWDENYGEGGVAGGDNIAFTVNEGDTVTFRFDSATNNPSITVESDDGGLEPGDDDLVRPAIRHPFQDEILYFAIPDRFNDGDPSNNCGDYAGTCVAGDTEANVLTHGYLPADRGYYHGGDIAGLHDKLDYLENLGVTAIWVGPIYKNKTVQPDSSNLYGYSSGYHGYWILDFQQVDPHLGTNAEFQALVDDAHSRGMQVFMDIVTNHTADVVQLEGNAGYRNKSDFPYTDVDGVPFDDSDFAYFGQDDYTFPAVDETSFPYLPTVPAGEEDAKNPEWLNDPLLYHNRGDSSFTGENSLYGDFFGLDDLWTERKEVVDGMIDIYSFWIEEFGVDGFRIDTTKHVNMEFWQAFGPDILEAADAAGIAHFFAFGEVFDQQFGPRFLSEFSTTGQLQSTIDFAFQLAARDFASIGGATDNLWDFFAGDDYYTDADSNVYAMPTFVGNHDMGRIGYFLQRVDQPGADDAELLSRSILAQALMFFSRGQPVIYYGDEQGFVGDGGDKLARQDMFANAVPEYEDDDLIGTDATTSDDNFDETHPIYAALAQYSAVYQTHPALRSGAQIHRVSGDEAGIYAFSRIDRDEQVEYIVAFNNAVTEQTANVPTFYEEGTVFGYVIGAGGGSATVNAAGELPVTVPPLSFSIYYAPEPVTAGDTAPGISITTLEDGDQVELAVEDLDGHAVLQRIEIGAELDVEVFAEVTFAVSVDGGGYEPIGTDDNPPYRVFYDATDVLGSSLSFKAIVDDLQGNLNADKVVDVVAVEETPPPAGTASYAIIHYFRADGDYGDHTTGDFNDYWGLHLWGDGIDPSEVTDWTSPKPFLGEDEYGRFAWVELADPSQPVNFIVHRGDVKDGTDADRSFDASANPEIWLKSDDGAEYTSQAAAQGYATIRYHRPDGDYGDPTSDDFNDFWGLHLWGDAIDPSEGTDWTEPKKPDGEDDYGLFWLVDLQDPSLPLNYIIHRGDEKDPGPDQSFFPNDSATVWIQSGDETIYTQRGAAENVATIHYHRPDGDYGDPTSDDFNDFWGLHVWTGAGAPTDWTDPVRAATEDIFGARYDVPLADGADQLAYIIHRGDEKDPGPDQFLVFDASGYEVWQLSGADPEDPYILPVPRGPGNTGDLTKQQAHWVAEDTIVWEAAVDSGATYELWYSTDAKLELQDDGSVTGGSSIPLTVGGTYPTDVDGQLHLGGLPTLIIDPAELEMVPDILRGQFAVVATSGDGVRFGATGLQIPGVLDDLYEYDGDLGVVWDGDAPTMRLWAPTAKSVKLHLFATAEQADPSDTFDMVRDDASGTWSLAGDPSWDGWYYLYEVEVFAPTTGAIEANLVTDPYSLSLATNSARTQIVDLRDTALQPAGWEATVKPALTQPEDIAIYELHVRDFSVDDPTVPEAYRGTYKAFTVDSDGTDHLEALAEAGLTHLHLLPVFDIATINENKDEWQAPDPAELATYPPDSEEQQAAVSATADLDGFNWGYDPWHYTTPEGSYATDPAGSTRVVEFREMVQALNESGLRVVMDVVYNHTNASGQADKSVLDRIVPGYYHRLNGDGVVETSTCCANTATEHAMMEKLMIDSVVTWARDYKVDGFRFDLMGHHSLANMLDVRAALDELTLAEDGVDGASIYLYGEGWNFGEVADDARFVQATQLNLFGTGIGSFNDRVRDAIRGGGPFDGGDSLVLNQGFVNGAYYDPNELVVANGVPEADQLAELLLSADQIRVGLAGNLADYEFVDRNGDLVPGSAVDYNGAPAGYTGDPQEHISYASAHDNQTLFDVGQYHHPVAASMEERVRAQNVAMDVTALSQGVPFFHAGVDLLRSKSFDRDSFNSGDWFNSIDWSHATTNWGVGLPVAEKNEADWALMAPLLADPDLAPGQSDVEASVAHLQEILAVRNSSPLFRLPTEQDIVERLDFHNTGPDQIPGLIVMSVDDTVGADLDPNADAVWALFNPTDDDVQFTVGALAGEDVILHPIQAASLDPVVQTAGFDAATGSFTVPARTTAVFIDQESDVTPPQATAELVLVEGTGIGSGVFEVVAFCVDDRDPEPAVAATINGTSVEPGEVLTLVQSRRPSVEVVDGQLVIYDRQFRLVVTCTDTAGNVGTASTGVRLGGRQPR